MPQLDISATISHNDASENWDDDFDFQSKHSKPPSPSNECPPVATTSKAIGNIAVPSLHREEESWDDAYEDEDDSDHARVKAREVPKAHQRESDEDMESWGSGSDWTGDGNGEDESQLHDNYTRTSIEPPEPRSPSSNSHSTSSRSGPRFPTMSHSPFPATTSKPSTSAQRSPTSAFFSRISPVKKWKGRDTGATSNQESRGKEKEREKVGPEVRVVPEGSQKSVSRWTKRRESTTPVALKTKEPSQLKRVFSGANLASATPSPPRQPKLKARLRAKTTVAPSSQMQPPLSPLTPDLTLSPFSPSSIPPKSPALSSNPLPPPSTPRSPKTRPTVVAPSLAPTASLPLVTSSAYNLPLTPSKNSQQPAPMLTPRRSSLGDLKRPQLKIPERISRAQRDIKRDMGDVKEFAACVEQLKNLQQIYAALLRDLRVSLSDEESSQPSSSISSSSPMPITRPRGPSFSPIKRRGTVATTSPQSSPTKPSKRKFSFASATPSSPSPFSRALDRLDAEYGVWWECAELLIALGGRKGDSDEDTRSDDDAAYGLGLAVGMTRGRRPRAVTLGSDGSGSAAGPSSTSSSVGPPLASPPRWRATTGRAGGRDLTPRQLMILRSMLESNSGVGWDPRMAEGRKSPRQRGAGSPFDASVRAKGAGGGGLGIRELWRGLKWGSGTAGHEDGEAAPRESSSGDSSASDSFASAQRGTFGARSARAPSPSKNTATSSSTTVLSWRKQPTRRPSLAGIFGLGQKSTTMQTSDSLTQQTLTVERDWDGMDLDEPTGTVRGTKRPKSKESLRTPSKPKPKPSLTLRSRPRDLSSSPDKPSSSSPRLFISFTDSSPSSADPASPKRKRLFSSTARSPSRSADTRTLRPTALAAHLAFTPENIRPLLGHARDVGARLNECIGEVRGMMGGMSVV